MVFFWFFYSINNVCYFILYIKKLNFIYKININVNYLRNYDTNNIHYYLLFVIVLHIIIYSNNV